jgi:hypothetical protein
MIMGILRQIAPVSTHDHGFSLFLAVIWIMGAPRRPGRSFTPEEPHPWTIVPVRDAVPQTG